MRATLGFVVGLATLAPSTSVFAKPAKAADDGGDKSTAQALLASGLRLFKAKDYLGALAVFKGAYARFPSTKILLNIATTLKQLGRDAEAANIYQRYLDAPDSDRSRHASVRKALASLDSKVGIVRVTVTPEDAEVQLAGEDDWQPASQLGRYRVAPGAFVVRARHDAYEPGETTGDVAAGEQATVALTLSPIPEAPAVATSAPPALGIASRELDEQPASSGMPTTRFGAYALAHVDITHAGGAARVAATFELIPRLQLELGALIGPASGGYAGARYAVTGGRFRPVIAVGMPVFIEDGARAAVRGAAALEIVVMPRISIVLEAGVERVLNPAMNYAETLFIPAIGAAGRL